MEETAAARTRSDGTRAGGKDGKRSEKMDKKSGSALARLADTGAVEKDAAQARGFVKDPDGNPGGCGAKCRESSISVYA